MHEGACGWVGKIEGGCSVAGDCRGTAADSLPRREQQHERGIMRSLAAALIGQHG